MDLLKILVRIFNFSIFLANKFYIRFLLDIFTMERKYKVKELNPKSMTCILANCPAIYEVEEITPEANRCMAHACPAIYEVEDLTPKSMKCVIANCPTIEEHEGKYLIIGKKANPSDFGLEKKVGKDEVLIEIPKEIIDNRRV